MVFFIIVVNIKIIAIIIVIVKTMIVITIQSNLCALQISVPSNDKRI